MKQYVSMYGMIAIVISGCFLSLMALKNFPSYTYKDILSGRFSVSIEENINKSSLLQESFLNIWATTQWLFFKQGLDGVVLGNDGWFYTADEFKQDRKSTQTLYTHMNFIKETSRFFEKHDAHLIILPIPLKADVYDDHLEVYQKPEPLAQSYKSFIDFLNNNNIANCPIREAFIDNKDKIPLFFKTDTHWTPTGSLLAAQNLKKCLELNDKLEEGKKENKNAGIHSGDLLSYLPINNDITRPEIFSSFQYPTPKNDNSDLFGDITPDIALVGTSYSANPKWQFSEAITYNLNRPVFNFARDGKGPFLNMKEYIENTKDTQKFPKILIWEIPIRYLTLPDKDDTK